MRRQPNALNLGKCARDVAVKRRRHNGKPPHEPRKLDRLGVREVSARQPRSRPLVTTILLCKILILFHRRKTPLPVFVPHRIRKQFQ